MFILETKWEQDTNYKGYYSLDSLQICTPTTIWILVGLLLVQRNIETIFGHCLSWNFFGRLLILYLMTLVASPFI